MAVNNRNPILDEKEKNKQQVQPQQVTQRPVQARAAASVDAAADKGATTKQVETKYTPSTVDGPIQSPAQQNTSGYRYDPASNVFYQQAMAMLREAKANKPSYAGTWDDELTSVYEEITNRDKFQYDINADMLYQNMKDQYVQQGQMAMKDTMGQAAALTGGYGNTYGQQVGQQAYDAHLLQLNEQIPDFYNMALQQYIAEGDQLMQQYGMLGEMADREYGRYQDDLNQYWQNIDYLTGEANTAYDRGYENWYNGLQLGMQAEDREYERQFAEEERRYGRQNDAYDRLFTLITGTGYTPTPEELARAGMSEAEAKALLKLYGGSSGGSPGKSPGKSPGEPVGEPVGEPPSTGLHGNPTQTDPIALTYDNVVQYLKETGKNSTDIMNETVWRDQKMMANQNPGAASWETQFPSYTEYLRYITKNR